MLDNESPKPKSGKTGRKSDRPEPPLTPDEVRLLWEFVRYGLGNPHLSAWEENFLNGVKHRLYSHAVWLSDKQQAIIRQIKDKLNYDRQDVPLPPIDPDGIDDNDDPDGWPVVRQRVDQFEDDESVGGLAAR
jgi:hypothetical protein